MYTENITRRNVLSKDCTDKANYLHWLVQGWETDDPNQALAHFLRALELKPGDPVVLDGIEHAREIIDAVAVSESEASGQSTEGNPAQPAVLTADQAVPVDPITARWVRKAQHPAIPYALYLAWLTLAEIITALSTPQVGLVLHSLLLLALFIQAAFSQRKNQYRLYLILALAPMVRLLSLSMPLLQFEFMNWYMVIGIPLILATFIAMRLADYKPYQVGFSLGRKWGLQGLVVLMGFGLGYLEYLILRPEPLIDSLTWQQFWYPALILLIFTGFLEEFIFRGMMQRAAVQGLGRLGLVFTAAVFAVLHIGYRSILDVIFVFIVGLIFSLVVQRTHSIWGVTLAHGLTNISLFLIFPFIL